MISRSASRMLLRMPANVLPRQSVTCAISWSIRSDGFIGSLCLQFLSRFHASSIGRSLRNKALSENLTERPLLRIFLHPLNREEPTLVTAIRLAGDPEEGTGLGPYSSTIYSYSPPNPPNRPPILKVRQAGYPWGPPATDRSSDTRATHMSTLRQIEANRRNAQKSTGPTPVTGKAASSMNALKTGIHAKSLVLPSEKLADLELLIDEYYQHRLPASPEARALLDDLIRCEWLQRRLHTAETQFWAFDNKDAWTPDNQYPLGQTVSRRSKAFGQLQWRINCTPPRRTWAVCRRRAVR